MVSLLIRAAYGGVREANSWGTWKLAAVARPLEAFSMLLEERLRDTLVMREDIFFWFKEEEEFHFSVFFVLYIFLQIDSLCSLYPITHL